jgi:hypothetical protein
MVMSKKLRLILLCSVAIGSGYALAQDSDQIYQNSQGLSLFEAVEVAAGGSSGANRTPRRRQDTVSGPEFTLLGTSRIGGSYSAILRDRSGESILVRSQENTATAIEGHPGYSVLSVGAGKLSLRYPVSVPCVGNVGQGVSCNADPNTAELVLSSSVPLSRPATSATFEQQAGSTESSTAQSINPFEGIIAAQRDGNDPAQDGGVRGERFVPKRISPEDVPSGMRVVATPFGDRLVEQ